mmetsp:Transcript_5986/g.7629  ORF Transcript_5986/g.7629 Transcript_5986/m.7629 type:complete len:687 (-) Transcript_5986:6-2066(-)
MASPSQVSDIEHDFTKTQLALFFSILILAVDSLNPVKIFQHVFPQVATWHIATISTIIMIYIFITEMKQLLYYSVKIFFHSILSIFFRDVKIIGHRNIPHYGPVIFAGNHANQFIDSVVLMSTCKRTVSFLMAEISYNLMLVGHIAWAMNVVPVKRAMDSAFKGSGEIVEFKLVIFDDDDDDNDDDHDNDVKEVRIGIKGKETKFTSELRVKDKIRFPGCPNGLKVIVVHSDTYMEVNGIDLPSHHDNDVSSKSKPSSKSKTPTVIIDSIQTPFVYDVLKRTDHAKVFEKVLAKLACHKSIALFPEGGSHDRTDLLPLKAGVALIAYSSFLESGVNAPIIPVGLNYFRGHKIRGRVTVEYGRPIYIDPVTLPDFEAGGERRINACNDILERIEDSLRSVIVSAPDYQTLKLIHTARRLYRSKYVSTYEKQDLSRRFAEGYKRLLLLAKGNPPESWLALQERLRNYQKELDDLGIFDYQVPGLINERIETYGDVLLQAMRLPFRICELFLLILVSLIPSLFLNLPVGIIAHYYAIWRREKHLKISKVKIRGMDTMLTEKVLLCIVLVPSLWIFYGLVLFFRSDSTDLPTVMFVFYSFPLFSYMGVISTEAGMIEIKDLRPFLKRLFPSSRKRLMKLPEERMQLRKDLRRFIHDIGPKLGDVYSEKDLDWADFQKSIRISLKEGKKDV